MGVPAFFTWLISKYPNIAMKMSTNHKFIVDYFYLDMNGIIHPCCHPEGKLKPANEDEMLEFMYRYLDMLLQYVEPKQLLFIAIDGPPPQSKIMQQRERRFIHEYEANAQSADADTPQWDSNQITPGTAFMNKVANGLSKYIRNVLANDARYKDLKIILSDSSVPGEGEHKILDFIRTLRYRGDYKESASHLLFSNDADMVLLSLLLHESNAYLMRDIPLKRSQRSKTTLFQTKYNIVELRQLRKYISTDLSSDKVEYSHFKYDIDRVIDDFVFLSYFVGNDFIPCLPFMNMRDGAFEYLLQKYIECGKDLPAYLTNGIHINFDAVSVYLQVLAKEERDILTFRTHCFLDRMDPNAPYKRNMQQANKRKQEPSIAPSINKKRKLNDGTQLRIAVNKLAIDELNKNAKSDLDFIQFGKEGYKKRFYKLKFEEECGDGNTHSFVNRVVMEYIRALSWIQHYYYGGVVTWKWYYPYHYAPLMTDIIATDLSIYSTDALWSGYDKGEALRPLIQLALVMPKSSAHLTLPEVYFDAIFDKESQHYKCLKVYYPESFKLDLNFKELNWESIAKIKHVDVELLREVLMGIDDELSDEYKKRNTFGDHKVYMHSTQKHFADILDKEWGAVVLDPSDGDGDNDELGVYTVDIKIWNTLDVASQSRQCGECNDVYDNELKWKGVNEKDLKIVSQTMCKFFMAGKQTPRGNIVKYMKKRPSLWTKSVSRLRSDLKRSRKNTKTSHKRMVLQKQREKNGKMEKKNDTFISKLKSIGTKQKMNGTNASKLIIESVLSAINTSGSKAIWNNEKKNEKKNDKEIKMNVKTSKRFETKGNNVNYNEIKKKRKRKLKREKLRKMIKGSDMESASINIHRPLNKESAHRVIASNHRNMDKESIQSTERNAQICEVQSLIHRKAEINKKKKRKKRKKKHNIKKNAAQQ